LLAPIFRIYLCMQLADVSSQSRFTDNGFIGQFNRWCCFQRVTLFKWGKFKTKQFDKRRSYLSRF